MELLVDFFNLILYQPLFNALVLLYKYLPGHDFGLAVIVLTILVKVLFYPLGIKAIVSQRVLSELQPKIKELQEKYKGDKQKQTKAIMELYQKEKINPFSGCLPILVQLPVLIALYRVFWKGFQQAQVGTYLYSFIVLSQPISPFFLGLIDLSRPNLILAFLAGIFQFFQTKMISPKTSPSKNKKNDFSQIIQKQMLYFFPFFTVLILWKMPAAIAIYWLTSTIFSIIQQKFVLKKYPSRHA